jgi:hypothetical protein
MSVSNEIPRAPSKGKLACKACRTEHVCQWLYLVEICDCNTPLSCICFGCYNKAEEFGKTNPVTQIKFKSLAAARWTQRKKVSGKHSSYDRGKVWKQAAKKVGARHEGASKQEWREEVKRQCQIDE